MTFAVAQDGSVSARFSARFLFEGYKGVLHGGVCAALLDSAMTNCLFARGLPAVTAELSVKYLKPVRCGRDLDVKGWLVKEYPPLYVLKGEISQGGNRLVCGEAKFIQTQDGV
ncbi:MAG TPA: PaaI family thioesterase [Elusimicrobiales bacterium]|nr:PaaI family thioesterase [Elusimicrobiales bacterium]